MRNYSESFLRYGFIADPTNSSKPYCVVCERSFSNHFMSRLKMEKHLQVIHPHLASANAETFIQFARKCRRKFFINCPAQDYKQFTFEACRLIAQTDSPHTTGEKLILPVLESFFKHCLHADFTEIKPNLHLSANTVHRRIKQLSDNVESQLVLKLRRTNFAIQVDAAKTPDNRAFLMSFCWYVDPISKTLDEDFLCVTKLPERSTADAIYQSVSKYLDSQSIPIESVIACATDGARPMLGPKNGFVALLQRRVPRIIFTHCALH